MKSYDFKVLGEKLKEHGLDVAEDSLEALYKSVMEWIKESASASENKIDDVVVIASQYIDDLVLPAIDRIDGEEG